MYDLIIIGAGPAGVAAGIYAARQRLKILIISKDIGGQVAKKAVDIENYPGFEKISGPDLVELYKKQIKTNKLEVIQEEVTHIKKNEDFVIYVKSGKEFQALSVIITSGAESKKINIPGEEEFAGKGVSYCSLCLPAHQEVVANNSLERIGSIGITDRVLTGKGDFQNINQIMSRDYTGQLITIKTKFFKEPVQLTANHPVMVGNTKKVLYGIEVLSKPYWKKAQDLTNQDMVLYPIISKTKDVKYIYFSKILHVDVLNGLAKNHQETHTSLRLHDKIPVSKEFLRLAGYYLSEGSLGKSEVRFYFNKNEKEFILDVQQLLKKVFGLNSMLITKDNVTCVDVTSRLLVNLFHILFGKNAPNKEIPHWVFFLPKIKQKELIKGVYRGDGCVKYKDFELVTVSRKLAYQMRDLLLRFGIVPGIDRRDKEKLNTVPGEVGGRKIRFNYDRYHVRTGGFYLQAMSQLLGVDHPKIKNRNRTFAHAWIRDNYLYLPIKEIFSENYQGRVFNLVVDKNSTFVANNFIVHNCDGPVFKNKVVAVVGGGNNGFESAMFLSNYVKHAYILEYSDKVNADLENQELVSSNKNIEIITNAKMEKIEGKAFVQSVTYEDRISGEKKKLDVNGVFVEIGYSPATEFAKDLVELNDKHEIVFDPKTLETKTPGLFSAGDCNVSKYKQIVTASGQGAIAALSAYEYIKKITHARSK